MLAEKQRVEAYKLMQSKSQNVRTMSLKKQYTNINSEQRARAPVISPLGSYSGKEEGGFKLRTSQGTALQRDSMATYEEGHSSYRSYKDKRSPKKTSMKISFDVEAVEIEKNGSLKLKNQQSPRKSSRRYSSGLVGK